MTAQFPDRLDLEGEKLALFTNPLEDYFCNEHPRPRFVDGMTALWRGYVASWQIAGGKLYLTAISANVRDGAAVHELTLEEMFGEAGPIFASWFSGRLRVPRGKLVEYVHMGYASRYAWETLIDVEKGLVTGLENTPESKASDVKLPKTKRRFFFFQ